MRLRLTFLAKFALVTFVVMMLVAFFLAYFLETAHLEALERNEGTNAAAQVSALLAKPIYEYEQHPSAHSLAELQRVAAASVVLQYVTATRVYQPNGSALYPRGAPPDRADVQATLKANDVWHKRSKDAAGQEVRTYFSPLGAISGSQDVAVIAVDIDRALLDVQARQERRLAIGGTAAAVALIFVSLVTLAAGASRELERRRRESETSFVQTLGVLADIVDRRDPYTANHSKRVAAYSRLLGTELGLPERELVVIESGALLHDLGKIGIPDAVLLKPARLTDDERAVINGHPVIGAEILGSITAMEDVVPCVMHHHERIDGGGYPQKLRGDEIPFGARIIAVADTFDAMTTDRPYRRALSATVALAEMRRVAGAQLDANCVEAFAVLVDAGTIVPPVPAQDEAELGAAFGPQRRVFA